MNPVSQKNEVFSERSPLLRRPLRPCRTIRQEQVQLSASRPLRLQSMEVQDGVAAHDHDYYELCVVRAGTAKHQTDHADSILTPGSVIIMAPGQTHAFANARGLKVTNIYYLSEWLLSDLRSLWDQEGLLQLFLAASMFRRPMRDLPVPQFSLTDMERKAAFRELEDAGNELEQRTPSSVYLKSSLLKFMILLCRAYARGEPTRALGFAFRREIWMTLETIEDSIRQSLPFGVSNMAVKCGLSPDHLGHLFKEAVGCSPMDYFQRRRIQHACAWLLNPRHSITDIALTLGFSDAAHFSRLFRRYHGASPREYRNTYVAGPSLA
jgi:AraC-like DNA-binding protein/mannose-6-phosphate isomerase-like protein (cupin superfamily)